MSASSRQRILNVMGTFRPAFRSVAQSLTDIDLILVEEAFERLLLVKKKKNKKEINGKRSLTDIRIMTECLARWVYLHVFGVVLVKYIKAIRNLPHWSMFLSRI